MKKFGIGKKDKGDDADDSKRSQLFGKSSKSKSSAPSANPYAAPQNGLGQDPYAKPQGYPPNDPSRSSVASQPPPYPGGGKEGGSATSRARQDKSPVPPGGYGGAPRFNNQGYGNQGGYGGDRFGGPNGGANPPGRSGGGYGGLGQTQEGDDNRDALFSGAKQRADERQHQGLPPDNGQPGGGYGMEPGYDQQRYKKYDQDRQLTAEEEEEEDVQDTKEQIRDMKQQDVSSTRNALRIAAQAEESGRATLERLGAQGEKIHNTEKNLDLAASGNREAEEKAREIKHLNRSMWAMQVNNPFTKTRRKADRDEKILETHRTERAERDATRAAAWASANRQAETDRKLRDPQNPATKKSNLAERSKYQFEADSEDEAMEDEIDSNIDALGGAANRLNRLGKAMNGELEVQNKHIDRIGEKVSTFQTLLYKHDISPQDITLNQPSMTRQPPTHNHQPSASAPKPYSTRSFHFLLLSPSDLADPPSRSQIHSRLRHFASLTGGIDIAVIFLVTPTVTATAASIPSSKRSTSTTGDENETVAQTAGEVQKAEGGNYEHEGHAEYADADRRGGHVGHAPAKRGGSSGCPNPIRAYAQLQVDTLGDSDTAGVVLLPLWRVDALAEALHMYVNRVVGAGAAAATKPERNLARTTVQELLPHCTATPTPLSEHTTLTLTELHPTMRSLALACLTDAGAARIREALKAESGVLAQRVPTDEGERRTGVMGGKEADWEVARKVAEREAEGIVMFWRDEWLMD
ncbi:MAG: Meiosis-specific subunit of the t-SNARE complex [Alyxoria varia]|nr:MAG: Meiosis-specific subunit of the t-SNARE complex [Alyxoria varia]